MATPRETAAVPAATQVQIRFRAGGGFFTATTRRALTRAVLPAVTVTCSLCTAPVRGWRTSTA